MSGTTANFAFPYATNPDTPDVPRDTKAIADQAELVLTTGFHTRVVQRLALTAQNTFTNQTTYADFPNATDAAALQISFVKAFAATRLVLTVHASCQLSAGAAQALVLGLRIATTDYDVARFRFPAATSRNLLTGSREVTGLAAGTYTIKPRFLAATASGVDFFGSGDDWITYSVTEIM